MKQTNPFANARRYQTTGPRGCADHQFNPDRGHASLVSGTAYFTPEIIDIIPI